MRQGLSSLLSSWDFWQNLSFSAWLERLGLFLTQFSMMDVVDIVIIAVLLYQFYVLLSGSRAWNVFRGIIALVGVWFVAVQLDLTVTRWLFARAAPVGFIALVVIFQPELRAVLERVGQVQRGAGSTDDSAVKAIMSAIQSLAEDRVGALIAVERHTPLQEFGELGTPLGAAVSTALLQTIFDSKGPLHDGGVVIRHDTITHAGAIFPLTNADRGWSIAYGTRHRAAAGLAEVSDALVIVVSEERGTLSMANQGKFRANVSAADIFNVLKEIYEN